MIGLLVCTLAVLSAGAQQDTLKFRICLKDKADERGLLFFIRR